MDETDGEPLDENDGRSNEQNRTVETENDTCVNGRDGWMKDNSKKSIDYDTVRNTSLGNGQTYYKPMSQHFRNNRVGVQPADDSVNLVEIRPGRVLRIVHMNAAKRDTIDEAYIQRHLARENDDNCSPVNKHNSIPDTGDTTRGDGCDIWSKFGRRRVRKTDEHIQDKKFVLFFLHGVGGSSDVWTSQMRHFAASGYQIIAPDLIGHGFSCAPAGSSAYMFREIAQDVCALFDLYCHRDNVIIAHSYGTSFAAVLARRRSWCISHLIFISGGAPIPLGPQLGVFSMPTWLLNCCKPVIRNNFNRNAFYKRSHAGMQQAAGGSFDVPGYVLKHIMNGEVWPEGGDHYHQAINMPTLVIHGREDRLVSIEDDQYMAQVIPGSVFILLDKASHMVMIEQADKVNGLIEDFISDDSLQSGFAQ